jgi:hypothetical protein
MNAQLNTQSPVLDVIAGRNNDRDDLPKLLDEDKLEVAEASLLGLPSLPVLWLDEHRLMAAEDGLRL